MGHASSSNRRLQAANGVVVNDAKRPKAKSPVLASPGESATTGDIQTVIARPKISKTPSMLASFVSEKVKARALTIDDEPTPALLENNYIGGDSVRHNRKVSGSPKTIAKMRAASTGQEQRQPRIKTRIGKSKAKEFVSDDGKLKIPIDKAKASFIAALAKSPLLSQTPKELRETLCVVSKKMRFGVYSPSR